MDLEKERGITIQMHPVTMNYPAKDGQIYKLEPHGHARHVTRLRGLALAGACEGRWLLIDAAQGVEAQAGERPPAFAQGLKVIPVINKIDLPSAKSRAMYEQLEDILTIPAEERSWPAASRVSASRYPRGGRDPRPRRAGRLSDHAHARCLTPSTSVPTASFHTCGFFPARIPVSGEMMMLMSSGQKSEINRRSACFTRA